MLRNYIKYSFLHVKKKPLRAVFNWKIVIQVKKLNLSRSVAHSCSRWMTDWIYEAPTTIQWLGDQMLSSESAA